MNAIEQLFVSNLLLDSEKVYMIEMLVILSHSLNPAEKLDFIHKTILGQIEGDWASIEIESTLKVPANLAKLLRETSGRLDIPKVGFV
jgi:hypothetical protein